MNILMLAAGAAPSEDRAPTYPLWLSDRNGDTLIERQVKALQRLDAPRFIFAFRRADIRTFHLDNMVSLMAPGCAVVDVAGDTKGALCTALLAVGEIDPEDELTILSVTDVIDADIPAIVTVFKKQGADAGVVIFDSLHPRYSYVRCDDDGFVVEAAEKRPISRHASAGLYWFARAGDFFDAAKSMIFKDAAVQGQFFICPALNELVLRRKRIATYRIEANQYHPIKALDQVETFENILESKAIS